jgi:hypothetical protein
MNNLGAKESTYVNTSGENSEELRALRYSYNRTAFDVDIDDLEKHPWRQPHADLSDYFNYGFDEKTWRVGLHLSTFLAFLKSLMCGFFKSHLPLLFSPVSVSLAILCQTIAISR